MIRGVGVVEDDPIRCQLGDGALIEILHTDFILSKILGRFVGVPKA